MKCNLYVLHIFDYENKYSGLRQDTFKTILLSNHDKNRILLHKKGIDTCVHIVIYLNVYSVVNYNGYVIDRHATYPKIAQAAEHYYYTLPLAGRKAGKAGLLAWK